MPLGEPDDDATAQRTARIVRSLTGKDVRCTAEVPDESEVEDDDA